MSSNDRSRRWACFLRTVLERPWDAVLQVTGKPLHNERAHVAEQRGVHDWTHDRDRVQHGGALEAVVCNGKEFNDAHASEHL